VQNVELTNPSALFAPRGFSHVGIVPAGRRLIYVSGQVAVDANNTLVGEGDFTAQATRVFENLRIALAEAGATFTDVVKFTTYLIRATDLPALREIRDRFIDTQRPPASTLLVVAGLANPKFLLEIEAVAVAPA
jgi:enamine deaminase RidA (YjgF/YER057c/UK114 family)